MEIEDERISELLVVLEDVGERFGHLDHWAFVQLADDHLKNNKNCCWFLYIVFKKKPKKWFTVYFVHDSTVRELINTTDDA